MSENETLEVNKTQPTATVNEDLKNEPTQGTDNQPVYTKEQFDAAMKSARKHGEERVAKQFDGVDVSTYKTLLEKEEQSKLEEQKRKGEFEKILKEQAEKASSKVSALTDELTKIKVDGALINAASKYKAVNPEQVVKLVREQVRMSETGIVEVVDPKTGHTKYTESGEPLDIDNAVGQWLQANPHFVQSGPSGSGSSSNQSPEGVSKNVDLNKLDLKDPKQRKLYAEMRKGIYPNVI